MVFMLKQHRLTGKTIRTFRITLYCLTIAKILLKRKSLMRVIGLGKSLKYTTSHKNRPHAKAESGVFFFFDVARKGAYRIRGRAADKRKRRAAFLPTSCDRGEWCRFFFFKVARKGAYLSYVTAAGVPRTKGKDALIYAVAHKKRLFDRQSKSL